MSSSNNRLDVIGFMSRVRSTVAGSFAATADRADAAMRQELSEPYPPASAPGEPPHKRTGELAEGVSSSVTPTEADVSFRQTVTRAGNSAIPGYLEHGTEEMEPRPFVGPIAREFGPQFKEDAADALREEFSR